LLTKCASKKIENRSIFDENMVNHKVGRFFETQCSYFTAIGSCSLKTVADRQRHAAYHNKEYSDKLFIGVNIDDFE